MMKHRINTDLFLRIAVTRIGGEPEDFSTANDITVTVLHMYHNWRRQEEYQISGNEVYIYTPHGAGYAWVKIVLITDCMHLILVNN